MKKLITLISLIAIFALLLVGCGGQQSQPKEVASNGETNAKEVNFPTRAIELIVPYNAGVGVDLTARTIAPFLEEELGQPCVIINKPGGGSVVGLTEMANAKADGYTIGIVTLPALCTNYLAGNLTFDPRTAFKYLGSVIMMPTTVCVSKDSQFNDLNDLMEYLKEHPNELSYAATGLVSLDAVSAMSLGEAVDSSFKIVNFEGGNEAISAVMGGHVDAVGLTVDEAIEFYKSGELKVLGVGGDSRDPQMPDVPTFKEAGYEIAVQGAIRGYVAPAGTDDEIVKIFQEAIKKICVNEKFQETSEGVGLPVTYGDPDSFAQTVNDLIEELKDVVPKNN